MSKYKEDQVVHFHVATGYVGSAHKEATPLGKLIGCGNAELEMESNDYVEAEIEEAFHAFLVNNLDAGWHVEANDE